MTARTPGAATTAGGSACHPRRLLRAVSALVVLLSAACQDAAAPGAPVPLAGEWGYEAVQEQPPASIEGGIRWQARGRNAVEGTFAVLERGAVAAREVSGQASGQLTQDSLATFTLSWHDAGRIHVGTLRGDSLHGEWIEAGTPLRRGSFRMRRVNP